MNTCDYCEAPYDGQAYACPECVHAHNSDEPGPTLTIDGRELVKGGAEYNHYLNEVCNNE